MKYIGRKPRAPLDVYIDDLYVLAGNSEDRRRLNIPPMPSAHLMVNLGDPVTIQEPAGGVAVPVSSGGWFMGLRTRRFIVEYGAKVLVIGVHFKPWGLAPFIPIPPGELRDGWIPADVLWGASVDRLREQLVAARSVEEMLEQLENELQARLVPELSSGMNLVSGAALTVAASWGAIPVTALVDKSGVSSNRLAAAFTAQVGVGPKRLSRIYRFAHLLLSIDASRPVSWAELADAVGYYDQPHLINDFKGFTGLTPSAYLELRRRHPHDVGDPMDRGPMPAE
ncbi:helix-turn-helix domain-containing protein [Arthrobacter woluwensis]|uniref:helix-turn-helix domain-containing protein n=1 Tax=Arthrobacter woluwensis TaxID=156980 RepID=UPI0038195990